jgi:hypothetical protein
VLKLLTTTGARPEAFKLCQQWMSRQTYSGPVHWIIVDDGEVPQEISIKKDNWTIEVIRPTPYWKVGDNTQARNLTVGLEVISDKDRLVIIEDDDWYAADWLTTVDEYLDKADLVGESNALYYNIKTLRYAYMQNFAHASLCATGLKGKALTALKEAVKEKNKFIDLDLWKQELKKYLFTGDRVIGIKGLPGRQGIGSGHKDTFARTVDHNYKLLKQKIGQDYIFYTAVTKET